MIGIKVGGEVKGLKVRDCTFEGCDTAIDIEGKLEDSTFEGNKIVGNYENIVDEIVTQLKDQLIEKEKDIEKIDTKEKIIDFLSNIASNVVASIILK